MSRVDSAQIGISKARLPIQGCVLASDAFFPFRDGVDVAAKAGIRAVIQPGGSVKDQEVIELQTSMTWRWYSLASVISSIS